MVILGEALRDIQAVKDALGVQDLTTPEGVQNGLKLQGEIKGINRVIDRIFELAEGVE